MRQASFNTSSQCYSPYRITAVTSVETLAVAIGAIRRRSNQERRAADGLAFRWVCCQGLSRLYGDGWSNRPHADKALDARRSRLQHM
ncbi:hypothetical protein HPP92_028841 [Vanilla planifolia]|uniref:Uncharacterized protein n=1 Tax=Vanilla planifolia TaxID=51239 RepID=A0A835P666_VANPL|nr:hypothetical protein HPP92_028841 [Vanilla planifolia]KAG0446436.1 hypothetical protein HPP92_028830 [Vanilla planifolia]